MLDDTTSNKKTKNQLLYIKKNHYEFIIFAEYNKALSQRQQLDGQLNENIMVKKELDILKEENDVFKLIGPVLVKQELCEAKQNVDKRMDYIKSEL